MIEFKRAGVVLQTTALAFESMGVLNPAVIIHNGVIHMFYRAVAKDSKSTIGYCLFQTPLLVDKRMEKPLLVGDTIHEKMGMEDPRIVEIDGLFYLSYTAFDGKSALGSLLLSKDLIHFYGKRVIVALKKLNTKKNLLAERFRWDKNLVFFPRRINGQIYFMHRIKPHILLSSVANISEIDALFWERKPLSKRNTRLYLKSREIGSNYVGAGCPPIETEAGWLLIYHAAYLLEDQIIYKIHVALLDIEQPSRVIAELPYPVLEPQTAYERFGIVNNVVFPTASIEILDTVYVYYGAADSCIACAYFSMSEMLQELLKHPLLESYDA
jgi:predicted GH43/DUF377 family glycosyl hydrolase